MLTKGYFSFYYVPVSIEIFVEGDMQTVYVCFFG